MKVLILLLSVVLAAASPRCGTPAASSAGDYGFGQGPPPGETVTVDGSVLTVTETFGDRMFTQIVTRYDAATLMLISAERTASCCMTFWHSSISRNADGSYDLESVTNLPSSQNDDVFKESRPHFRVLGNAPIIVGGLFFIPWIYHVTHASEVARIDFNPLHVEYLSISGTSPSPYPEDVPNSDKALKVSASGQQTTLWYDPCTFTLDAYQSNGYALVRHALLLQ